MKHVIALFDRLCLALAWLSGLIAAGVMSIIFVGVVMRYVFRRPLAGGFELIEVGMGLMVFTALPWLVRQRGNIRVTVLSDRFPPLAARLADLAGQVLGAGLMVLIARRVWMQGERLTNFGEVTMSLRIPKGLIAQGMSVMLVLTALAFLICALECLRRQYPDNAAQTGGGVR